MEIAGSHGQFPDHFSLLTAPFAQSSDAVWIDVDAGVGGSPIADGKEQADLSRTISAL